MLLFIIQLDPIQSYFNLKIGLPPVLKAGSSGIYNIKVKITILCRDRRRPVTIPLSSRPQNAKERLETLKNAQGRKGDGVRNNRDGGGMVTVTAQNRYHHCMFKLKLNLNAFFGDNRSVESQPVPAPTDPCCIMTFLISIRF